MIPTWKLASVLRKGSMAAARRQSQAPSNPRQNQLCLFANGPVSLYSQVLINDGSRYRRPPSTPKHRDRRASANQALQPRFADAHSGFGGKDVCHSNGNRSRPRSHCRKTLRCLSRDAMECDPRADRLPSDVPAPGVAVVIKVGRKLLVLGLLLAISGCQSGHRAGPKPHVSHAGRTCSPSGFGQMAHCF